MARIPTRTASRELPSGPSQLPGVRMTAAPTADQLGANAQVSNINARRDVTSALEHFSRATEMIERRKDNTAVMTALAEAQKAAAMHQNQIAERKGAFAEGATEDTSKWFDEQYEVLAGRLRNNRQREAFNEGWTKLRVNSEVYASKHEAVEGRQAMVDSANATIAGAIELAAANPDDPVALADYRDQILIATQNAMAAQGHKAGSNVTALAQLKNLSALHETMLGTMAKNDPDAAEDYLNRFKGEMNATSLERATKLVETQGRLKKAQSFADEVVASGMTEMEALAEARKRFDGEAEKDAVLEVKTRFVERNAARERMQRQAADEGWKILEQTGSMANIDPMTLNAMDGRDVAAMRRHLEQQAESRARRVAAEESRQFQRESRVYQRESQEWQREQRQRTVEQQARADQERKAADMYEQARDMALTDPETFKTQDWRRFNDVLSFDQIQSLRKMQETPPVKDFLTYTQQLDRASANLDKEDKAQFKMYVDNLMQQETEARGKELTQKERQELIDRSLLDVETPGSVFGRYWRDSDPAFAVEGNKRERMMIPGMPDAPKAAVDAYLSGVPKDAIPGLLEQAKQLGVDPDAKMLLEQHQFNLKRKQ